MKNIKVSVVTVTYNASKTLEVTIKSVLSQSYNNIEFIVVDGESSDGTIDILSKYSEKIVWTSEKDEGVYDAMNKGKRLATGDYLIFLGADDTFHSCDTIQKFVDSIDNSSFIYYGNVIYKETGTIYWGKFTKWKWGIGNISHQALFYPKHIYKKYDYNIHYKLYADYAYNLRLLADGFFFSYMSILISDYALGGLSSTRNDRNFEKDKIKLIREAVGFFPMVFGRVYRFAQLVKRLLH